MHTGDPMWQSSFVESGRAVWIGHKVSAAKSKLLLKKLPRESIQKL